MNMFSVLVKKEELMQWINWLAGDLFKVEVNPITKYDAGRGYVVQISISVADENFKKVLRHLGINAAFTFEVSDNKDGYYELPSDTMCTTFRNLHVWSLKVKKYHEKYLRRLADFLRNVENGEVDWGKDYEP